MCGPKTRIFKGTELGGYAVSKANAEVHVSGQIWSHIQDSSGIIVFWFLYAECRQAQFFLQKLICHTVC